MGFLKIFGIPLSFIESLKYHKIIRDNFVNFVIKALKSVTINKNPQFGYEFEFHKIKIDDEKKHVYLDLTAQNDIYKASTYKLNKGKKIITLNHSANYKINIHNNDINILNNSSIPINKRVFKNNISPEQNSRIFSHKMKNNLTEGNIKGELVIKSNKSQNFDTQRINNNNNAYNNNYRMIKYGIDMNNQQNMTNDNITVII